ncbi:hypothetical protein DWB68_10295 [Galactobacter valiniphilus]|uniref:Uncharacterized protein n=1 Tax=Galactobacter valiniphilus TaxID=2676122 RepID=A0A399JBJ1_9MICC|nr:hypothetical protein [Galactobacter valiniphilus]RII41907.1 hypothetical protein DWB68_10295 [Galactobacter valiniphilus]
MSTKNWQRAVHDAEQERDNALAQLAHEQATRRQWQTQYQAEHLDYLNDVEADRDRLRDEIKALAAALHAKGWAAHDENDPGSASAYGHAAAALRALLDGEAKG